MKTRTMWEWLAVYEQKIGLAYRPQESELYTFSPEHGILSFIERIRSLGFLRSNGHGEYWVPRIKQFMTEGGFTTLRFFTRRNPRTWQRKYGAKIVSFVMEVNVNEDA